MIASTLISRYPYLLTLASYSIPLPLALQKIQYLKSTHHFPYKINMINFQRVIKVGYWALTDSSPVESDSKKMFKIGPLSFCGINPLVVYYIKIDTCTAVNHKKKFNWFCQYILHVSAVLTIFRCLST